MAAPGVFGKLNLKEQQEIVVLDAPASFEAEVARLKGVVVHRKAPKNAGVAFALAFVKRQVEVEAAAKALTRNAEGDVVLWFAYPKGSSKKYTCDFNRDTGWAALGAAGFEPVRMVAIDEDWSAVRFRRAGFIKTLTRDKVHALSALGRKRAGAKGK